MQANAKRGMGWRLGRNRKSHSLNPIPANSDYLDLLHKIIT